jgi:DNA-binding transcriptional ArsR family regulator
MTHFTDHRSSEDELEQLTSLFRLLSDRTRLNILMLLTQGDSDVTGLCRQLNLPQPTVSHHLGLLRVNNLIGNRREGKRMFYGINGRFDVPFANSLHFAFEAHSIRIESAAASRAVGVSAEELEGDGEKPVTPIEWQDPFAGGPALLGGE